MSLKTVIFLGGLLGQTIAGADPASLTSTVRVIHVDLNPQSQSAALRTLERLKDAALEACGGSPFSLAEFNAAIRASRCWHDSLADVVTRLGNPQLTQAFKRNAD